MMRDAQQDLLSPINWIGLVPRKLPAEPPVITAIFPANLFDIYNSSLQGIWFKIPLSKK
jgi:hypothetical protein